MSTVHKNMTGADLHEPKGADSATSGKIYVSDGLGSGVWTTASDVVTNTAFSTGDLKDTHKVTADTGWIMWTDQTIGDGSSSATSRANADTAALFALYWNNYSNTLCPVLPSGRGASAVADFAAHKTIGLPKAAGRVIGLAGTGSGLTVRTVGDGTVGSETSTLITANLPAYTPSSTAVFSSGSASIPVANLTSVGGATDASHVSLKNNANADAGTLSAGTSVTGTVTVTGVAQGGTSSAFSRMAPTAWVNKMIKL